MHLAPETPPSEALARWRGALPAPRLIQASLGLALLLVLGRLAGLTPQQLWAAAGALGGALLVWAGLDLALSWRHLRAAGVQLLRQLPQALAQSAPHRIAFTLQQSGHLPWRLALSDGVDPALECSDLPLNCQLPASGGLALRYRVVPSRRGMVRFSPASLRARSRWQLWDLTGRAGATQTRQVFPNFVAVARHLWLAGDQRLTEIGIKPAVNRGGGTEFMQLADYRRGDPVRHIDWKATLRRQKPVVRQFQDERDQTVMVLLDCGRRMRALEPGSAASHFDQTLNALMLLAWTALKDGDEVGVLTFGLPEGQQRRLAPRKGLATLNALMASLHDLEPSAEPSDILAAAQELMRLQHRRALVVVITDFRDEDVADLDAAMRLMRSRHLVMLASLRDLAAQQLLQTPLRDADDAAIAAAAHWQLQQRERVFKALSARDHLFVDAPPQQLAVALVNRYLAIKRSHKL